MAVKFDPENSWYHSILQKQYGDEKAKQLVKQSEYTIHRSLIRNEKKCKMCGKTFYSRSGGKVNCGSKDQIGTCSYKHQSVLTAQRKTAKAKKETKVSKIYKEFPWLKPTV